MNVRCVCGRRQSAERFVNRQQIAAEGEGAEPCSSSADWRNLAGSKESSGVNGVGVRGDGECESKDKGPGQQETLEHRGFSLRTEAGLVRCEKKIEKWFERGDFCGYDLLGVDGIAARAYIVSLTRVWDRSREESAG